MRKNNGFLLMGILYLVIVINFLPISMSASNWTSPTVISDGYQGSYWNPHPSWGPSIASDRDGGYHVVWYDMTDGVWGTDTEIFYVKYTSMSGWSNITVISDGYNNSYWNYGGSASPEIAIDHNETIHVVWADSTAGLWGGGISDTEIMHVQYSEEVGWSNITVISDDMSDWNVDDSTEPAIATDSQGGIHVVWTDYTDGVWGSDLEIFYVNYTAGVGWGTPVLISDGYFGSYWNSGDSVHPSIIADVSGTVHVVWCDSTPGVWGVDDEVMYANYTPAQGWSNVTVISDGYSNSYWNTGYSSYPVIAATDSVLHVVWHDSTNGYWGTNTEILYTRYSPGIGWQNVSSVSDDSTDWNSAPNTNPSIVADNSSGIHVAWISSNYIMYASYTAAQGWTRGVNTIIFTDSFCDNPDLAVSATEVCIISVKEPFVGVDSEIVAVFSTTYDAIPGFAYISVFLVVFFIGVMVRMLKILKKHNIS